MAEWQEAARGEVHKVQKIIGAGLDFCNKQKPRDHGPFQTGQTQRTNAPRPNSNGGIVSMEKSTLRQPVPRSRNSPMTNANNIGKKGVVSGVARKDTWPENVQADHPKLLLLPHPPSRREPLTTPLQS